MQQYSGREMEQIGHFWRDNERVEMPFDRHRPRLPQRRVVIFPGWRRSENVIDTLRHNDAMCYNVGILRRAPARETAGD